MDQLRIAIHVRLEADAELRAGPQEIQFFQFEAGTVRATLATEGDSRIEGPDVPRRHFEIDDTVVKRDGADHRLAQVPGVAQDASRLFDEAGLVELATLEQQLVFDGRLARGDVQPIGEAGEPCVFVGRFGVEQVTLVEVDLADARTLPLQLVVGRQIGDAGGFGLRDARLDAGQNLRLS